MVGNKLSGKGGGRRDGTHVENLPLGIGKVWEACYDPLFIDVEFVQADSDKDRSGVVRKH